MIRVVDLIHQVKGSANEVIEKSGVIVHALKYGKNWLYA
jgi:hypothetical protein